MLPVRVAVVVSCLLSLLTAHDSASGQVLPVVTRDWLKQEFLSWIHSPSDSTGAIQNAKWVAIRSRPETLSLLIELYEDPREDALVRSNVLYHIGGTGEVRAYE